MPKVKTRKTVLKRIKITKTGKVLRGQQMNQHRKAHKSGRRIRAMQKPIMLSKQQARMLKSFIHT